MKVKVKRIKRSSVSDVELTKSKLKIKARQFYHFAKAQLPESGAVDFLFHLDTGYIHCFVHKNNNAIDENLTFDFGGRIWNG